MSSSNDRKSRKDSIAAGTDRKSWAAMEEDKKRKKSKASWTIGTIFVVLLVAVILILNSSLVYTSIPAVKIGDVSYNTAQFDYYLKSQYAYFQQQYGSYASMFGLDTSKPLKSQECTMLQGGGTWYDYFQQQTISYMTQLTSMSEYAKKNNIALDDTDKANIDAQIKSYADAAVSNKAPSTKSYLVSIFGRGVSEKLVRGELERYALAQKAYSAMSDSYAGELKESDLETYYQQHKDEFDTFDFSFYLVNAEKVAKTPAEKTTATDASAAAQDTSVTAETMATAKAAADKIAAAAKASSGTKGFDAAVKSASGDDTAAATDQTGVSGSGVTDAYATWLKDASRKPGDVTVIESKDTGYFVVEFTGRGDNHYKMAEARHILIKAVAESDGTYTDAAKETAKKAAQKIYDEWKSGTATEDSFAELAKKDSEDTGSASNGGLYDSIYKDEMVPEFNNFVFADGREPGDTALVYGESSQYCGYHVVYYVGLNGLYSSYMAKNAIVNDKLSTWETGLTKNYQAATKFAIRFASVG